MPMDADALRRQAAKLLEQADQIDRVPQNDPYPDGTVLTFEAYNATTLSTLNYAAIRAGSRWWVTGRNRAQGITWRALLDFIGTADLHTLRHVTATAPAVKL